MSNKVTADPRPLWEAAGEAARMVREWGDFMLREWDASEWFQGKPQEALSALATSCPLDVLMDVALRCAAWAEEHKAGEVRRQFIARFNGFARLVAESIEAAKPSDHPLLGRYLTPEQSSGKEPITLLLGDSLTLAKLAVTHLPETLQAWSREMRQQDADGVVGKPAEAKAPKKKRSTVRGEASEKLIAALTQHHQYADGGCLNHEPIGNNELARLAKVGKATVSDFFKTKFNGYSNYRQICRNPRRLVAALKLLNQEYSPWVLLGADASKVGGDDNEGEDES